MINNKITFNRLKEKGNLMGDVLHQEEHRVSSIIAEYLAWPISRDVSYCGVSTNINSDNGGQVRVTFLR
jgi:hypothetical protein